MRRKLIVGNWKMNGSLAMNAELLSGIREGLAGIDCDLAICVPFPYLPQCQKDGWKHLRQTCSMSDGILDIIMIIGFMWMQKCFTMRLSCLD